MNSENIQDELSFESLKAKQREIRDGFPDDLGLRIHRAISWVHRAEKEISDSDAAFIFYWVAFNSAYAEDTMGVTAVGERSMFEEYFEKLLGLDTDHAIYNAIWQRFSDSIRVLLDNKYVFQPFWSHHNQLPGYDNWEKSFEGSKKKTGIALANEDTKLILTTLFDRLYVLRNQIVEVVPESRTVV